MCFIDGITKYRKWPKVLPIKIHAEIARCVWVFAHTIKIVSINSQLAANNYINLRHVLCLTNLIYLKYLEPTSSSAFPKSLGFAHFGACEEEKN